MQPLFVGNWKMHHGVQESRKFFEEFLENFKPLPGDSFADVGFAPAFTSIAAVNEVLKEVPGIQLGAQNVHWAPSGAHTGEISAGMLRELGCRFAIVGHSERRQFYGETDQAVAKRAQAAIAGQLTAIVCVGESRDDFEDGRTEKVVHKQLIGSLDGFTKAEAAQLVVAYEPVWAIGTGLAATPEIAGRVHAQIRQELCELFSAEVGSRVRILYGGSTTPDNVGELLLQPDVNGALVGGASLKPEVFNALIQNGRRAYSG